MTAEDRQAAEGISGRLQFYIIPETAHQLNRLQLPVEGQGSHKRDGLVRRRSFVTFAVPRERVEGDG